MTTFGKRLKQIREERGLSQKELADLVGIKQQSIDEIERDITQRTRFALELAENLGVRHEWLRRGEEPKYLPNSGPGAMTELMIQQEARRRAQEHLAGRNPTPEDLEACYEDYLRIARKWGRS